MNGRIEQELRDALSRREPPDGFAERVMARITEGRRQGGARRVFWIPAIAAALAALLTLGSIQESRREHRIRAEETQREAVYALQLTAEKLNRVHERLQKSAADLKIEGRLGEQL